VQITQRRWGTRKLVGLAAGLAAASVVAFAACGGGGGDTTPTKSAATTPAGGATAAATKGATTPVAGTTSTGGSSIPSDVGKSDKAKLTGAGATFPNPLYTRWFSDYKSSVASGVEVNYQSIGSGGGIKQITEKTVDFGASDAPMSDDEMSKAAGVQHIPTTLGAVVITYNLDGVSAPLKLDGDTIAKIYLGKITKWNDPAIAGQNSGVTLPSSDITVVHRSDGSGTTFVFTDYLSHVSADWKDGPGTSKNPQWPVGLGGQGNEGVSQQIKQNKNSIGYVELVYTQQNNLPAAQVKNKSGDYVTPSTDSTSLAASGVTIPADYRTSIVDSPTKGAYPIASFTYILLYKAQTDATKGKALVDLLWWAIHDGQKTTTELGYAPLPKEVVAMVEKTLTTDITANGQPILKAQ
jgi:phosphate transport system substrate-binding protein